MRPALILGCAAMIGAPLLARAQVTAPVEPAWTWASSTESPLAVSASELSDPEADLQRACGAPEQGLRAVARVLVERRAQGLGYLDPDGLTFAQRASGEPHVWPRAWIVSGRAMDHVASLKKLVAWRQSFRDEGVRRCGLASGYAPDGTQIIAAIALDAIADLTRPLPVRTHAGSWLTVEARVTIPATGARVVVVGPGGEPHTVPTSFDGSRVLARFAPDRPGAFTVQVVVDAATGPRPALEAQLFADTDPPVTIPNLPSPGETEGAGAADASTSLARMLASFRNLQRLPALTRDARLDAVALGHARRMMEARTVGHDVGDGDPAQRLQNAGLSAREAGENVAHAQTVALAHRALYQSPSHRANMQRAEFGQLGLAVIDDPAGSVWVAAVCARPLAAPGPK